MHQHYINWNRVRCDRIIRYYGKGFFKDKTLLDIGTFHGINGNIFSELGAIVTVQDAREEHVTSVLKKYPYLTGYVHDLNDGLGTDDFYDIILHMGVLYHLESVQSIRDACQHCTHLILESRVVDSIDPEYYLIKTENKNADDSSYTGNAIMPSPMLVETTLHEAGFEYVRIRDDLECGDHAYAWEELDNKKDMRLLPEQDDRPAVNAVLRALWFCKRNV